ncbi:hypothetical protein CCAX7_12250 [Capsulimonas corticalis]|uniref:Uncharacterized protein n=1 Tax=Capsulimonas corticalis TaxID=2219043 RepID=A0A402D4B6_9BACT|nr:endonuclease domain-containing protein [Capsulimonas corticalis]BDI29174.1 hypothetical protein CCAX7_12250 [Capsulimonas corticalis]
MHQKFAPVCAPGTLDKWSLARQMRRSPTAAEVKLWSYLRGNMMLGLKFRRQHVVDGFIADFYCHALRLVIEVDGGVHEDHLEYDQERQAFFEQSGLAVLRFSNEEILTKTNQVLAKIEIRCHQGMANTLRRQNRRSD